MAGLVCPDTDGDASSLWSTTDISSSVSDGSAVIQYQGTGVWVVGGVWCQKDWGLCVLQLHYHHEMVSLVLRTT